MMKLLSDIAHIVMHAQCQSFNDKKLKIGINISQILLYFVT